jgi:hypothetical protein
MAALDVNARIAAAGTDENALQQAALSAGLSLNDFFQLQTAVTNPKDLAASLSAIVNKDDLAQAALHTLSQVDYGGVIPEGTASSLMDAGKSVMSGNLMGAIGPIVAAAMTASGVGAPLVGAVGAGIALGEAALQALGVGQSHETCGWAVGGGCFNGTRPYGPRDPTWVPLPRVMNDRDNAAYFPHPGGYWANLMATKGSGQAPKGYFIDPWYSTIESELRYLEGKGHNLQTTAVAKDKRLNGFRLAYYRAYMGQLERAINGQKSVDPVTLLRQTALQWNSSHVGPSVSIPSNESMPGYYSGGSVDGVTGVQLGAPLEQHAGIFKQTYVERVLSGSIGGTRQAPLAINVGDPPQHPAAKKVIALHLMAASTAPLPQKVVAAHAVAATHPTNVVLPIVAKAPWWKKFAPYAPIAVGVALLPVVGPLAPLAGGLTTVWMKIGKK